MWAVLFADDIERQSGMGWDIQSRTHCTVSTYYAPGAGAHLEAVERESSKNVLKQHQKLLQKHAFQAPGITC